MSLSKAQRRERTANIRKAAIALIALAVVAASIGIYALVIEVHLIGASATMFTNCGTALEPFTYGFGSFESQACAVELQGQSVFAGVLGAAALLVAAGGAVLLAKNPAPLGF